MLDEEDDSSTGSTTLLDEDDVFFWLLLDCKVLLEDDFAELLLDFGDSLDDEVFSAGSESLFEEDVII